MNALTSMLRITDKSVSLSPEIALGVYGLSAGYGA